MSRWLLAAVVCLGFVDTSTAHTLFNAAEDKAAFCGVLLKRLNAGMSVSLSLQFSGVVTAQWSPARITFQASQSGPTLTEGIEYVAFDIDNDGREEVLIKYVTALRGRYGDVLWILRRRPEEIDFSSVPVFSWQEFAQLEAVESTAPWPYEARGLYLVEITPFSLDGWHYLSIRDTLFGNRSLPDRTWVIAKYTGRRGELGAYGHRTDDFETVCSLKRGAK